MNLQELKEKLIERLSEKCDKSFVTGIVEACFYAFEQLNKEQGLDTIDIRPKYFTDYCNRVASCFDKVHLEIKELREKYVISTNFLTESKDESQRMFDGLKDEIEKLNKSLNLFATQINPKQERFYYQNIHGDHYLIFDRKLKYWFDNHYSKNSSIEICKALNAMQSGK